MYNMMVAVFNNERLAIDGVHKLNELDNYGEIAVYENVLLKRNDDGSFEYLKDERSPEPFNAVGGMLVGTALGVFGGPVGALAGLITGLTVGSMVDVGRYSFDYDFLENFKEGIPVGTTALVAQIEEPGVTLVNDALQPFGANIWRSNVYAERDRYVEAQIDALDKGLDQADQELNKAAEEDKAAIKAKIAKLRAKRDKRVAELKAEFEEDVHDAKSGVERAKAQLQGKVDDVRRRVLEQRLAHQQKKIEKYEVQASKLNNELGKIHKAGA